jgi:hypothetical protein
MEGSKLPKPMVPLQAKPSRNEMHVLTGKYFVGISLVDGWFPFTGTTTFQKGEIP